MRAELVRAGCVWFAVWTLAGPGPLARAEEPPACVAVPPNAIPDPSIEGYPHVGPAQMRSLGGEVLGASLRRTIRRPVRSALEVVGRIAEQSRTRFDSLVHFPGAARAFPDQLAPPADGIVDGAYGSPPMPAALTLLPTSESALQGLLALLESASRRIDLMMYGWEDDPTGRTVGAALEEAARRGVRVRVLVDRGGFLIHNRAAAAGLPTFLDRLRAVPGVVVLEPPNAFLQFDHRKLAIVDGRTAWSGGMILTEVARRRWENLAFLAEGPVVAQFAGAFEARWQQAGGATCGPPDYEALHLPSGRCNANVRVVRTEGPERSLQDAVYHAIEHARHHVYVENCYISDTELAQKLIAARRRGVDVRVVLTLRGNIGPVNRYLVLQANRLHAGGVRVYLAPGMTHVKTMTADGVWSYLGTGNFDDLSLRNNHEIGLTVMSPGCAATLEATVLLPHMADAEELNSPLPLPHGWLLLELASPWF